MKIKLSNKLLTRQQVIDIWLKQNPNFLNNYCCPECRDLVVKTSIDVYYCENCFIEYEFPVAEYATGGMVKK